MNLKEQEILEYALKIVKDERKEFYKADYINSHSERCIEIPWVGSRLATFKIKSLLDVGFSMASLDYMGLLLYFKRLGIRLEAIDIIKPERVMSRYPENWLDEILSVPITIEDITKVKFDDKRFDAVSIISTIEHVGFDKATFNNIQTAFERQLNPKEVELVRDEKIEEDILDHLYEVLNTDGLIFISVPIGNGGAVLLKDSLGYYTAQWEYEEISWRKITNNSNYDLIEEYFYKLDNDGVWVEIATIQEAKGKSSEMKSHAQALAICTLKKKK